jgi:hypothetical protein
MDAKIFSLETQKSSIYDRRTKKYFDEVYRSYANRCYRSATVMLWSVIVCDLIFKLQELRDLYSDVGAQKILEEIEKLQKSDPYSPKWERELVKMVFERTQLLDTASNHKIITIQDHRHLSAHPIISDEDTLFEPTEEMVRSDIRNSIEAVLSKPPFLTQKILNTILEDLEEIKDSLPDDSSLRKYLQSKYLQSLNKETIIKLFRGLWKIVFRSEDERSDENREINFRALKIIFEKDRQNIVEAISQEANFYSKIANDDEAIKYLIEFLSLEKEIYDSLEDSAKELIKPILKDNLSYFGIAFFVSESPKDHVVKFTRWIEEKYHKEYGDNGHFLKKHHHRRFKNVCDEFGLKSEFRQFGITCFISSADFERADIYFDKYVEGNLGDYTKDEFEKLLKGANRNNQCYWRNRSRSGSDSVRILQAAKIKLGENYDFSEFRNLPIDRIDEAVEDDHGEV